MTSSTLIFKEFIGLRSKMYSLRVINNNSEFNLDLNKLKEEGVNDHKISLFIQNYGITKKAKGITKSALKTITFNDYYHCLFNLLINDINQHIIKSKFHTVYSSIHY